MKRYNAVYARQSKDKKDSLSIDTQLDKCISLVPCDEEYIIYDEDKGFSGKNTNRPSVTKLITDIKQKKIKKVIVYKLDRLSRNIVDFYNLYEIMKANECEFVSVNECFDTSSIMGRAMMGILAVFAQMERESIQQRVKDNYYYRIEADGTWPGGPAPFGFLNGKKEGGKKTLIENPEEIEAVKIAFNAYENDACISLAGVGRILESKGFQSRKRKTFDNVTIARILQSPVYVNADEKLFKYYQIQQCQFVNPIEQWSGFTSAHIVGKRAGNANTRKYTTLREQTVYLTNFSGIIDSEQFINVQNRLRENEQINRCNAPTKLEELAGKIKCAKCGYAVKMNCAPYLACYGRFGLRICDIGFKGIKFVDIQNTVGNEIQKILDDMERINQEKLDTINLKQREILDLQKEVDNLIQLSALGGLTAITVKIELDKRQKRINELELDIQMNHVSDIKNTISVKYHELELNQKKEIVRNLIEKILLSENGDIEIIWKI